MRTTLLCAGLAPAALAQGLRQATGGPQASAPPTATATATAAASSCTASLLTTLCDYKDPGPEFAVASTGKENCWEYCDAHPPCAFVVFAAGNPYTGTGTCWLYPGETFDESAGEPGCDYLSVYDKPDCGAAATPTAGACEATASPSAVAEVCGYPTPDDGCFSSCTASSGAADCASQCAAEDCAYAVFNVGSDGGSPYAPGTCWKYPDGAYDGGRAGECSGAPEQFVYNNTCARASAASASSSPSSTAHSTAPKPTGTSPPADSATAEEANKGKTSAGEGAAAQSIALSVPLAVGMAALLWCGL
jgi:hypothetical protein